MSVLLATTMVAALAAGCGSEASGEDTSLTSITVGIVPFSPNAVLFHAIDSGIFARHGLQVTTAPAAAPTPIVAAMVSGQQQFGFVTTPVLLNVNAEGTGVKCVTPVDGQVSTERDSNALVASQQSGITTLKDLSGTKVAVVQRSSINLIGAKKLAEDAGAQNIERVFLISSSWSVKYLKLSPEQAQAQILPTNYVPEINVESIGDIQDMMAGQGAIKTKVNPEDLVWKSQN